MFVSFINLTVKVERERGITVKAKTCSMLYRIDESEERDENGLNSTVRRKKKSVHRSDGSLNEVSVLGDDVFLLNLIDTPGHVDFSYEVQLRARM
jgi:translation elongation factor EF-4